METQKHFGQRWMDWEKTFVFFGKRLIRWLVPNGGTLFVLLALLFATNVWARPFQSLEMGGGGFSQKVPYQGRLADSAGAPLTGVYPMVFRIYASDAPTAPVLWEEQWTGANSVPVSDGLFHVMLGSWNVIPTTLVTGNSELWLGIAVGTDGEMSPRIRIGGGISALISGGVAPNTITTLQIADHSIQPEDLAAGAFPPGVPVGTVINWWRQDANTPLPTGDWAIADGSVVTDTASPLYGQALPNLTDRFVMGVSSANIGQTGGSNTLNLAHNHTVMSHTHTLPSHNHSSGTLQADVAVANDRVYVKRYNGSGWAASHADSTGSTHTNNYWSEYAADVDGSTGSSAVGTSGESAPNTDSQLSATTDNRPAYVGLLYLIRIK